MKQHMQPVLLVFLAWAPAAISQGGKGPLGNPYETCIAAEVAKAGGGMVAEAKARRACRERFPDQASEAQQAAAATAKSMAGGITTSATTTPVPAAGSGSGSGSTTATPAASAVPSTPALPSPVPSMPSPGASGGNPHGGPPGQSKK